MFKINDISLDACKKTWTKVLDFVPLEAVSGPGAADPDLACFRLELIGPAGQQNQNLEFLGKTLWAAAKPMQFLAKSHEDTLDGPQTIAIPG